MRPLLLLALAACSSLEIQHDPPSASPPTDFPGDSRIDRRCDACGPNEMCVQEFANCEDVGVFCKPRVEGCDAGSCSDACSEAYCPTPTVCSLENWCGARIPNGVVCYGG